MNVNDVRGSDALLVVEVADSSLDKDREIKAPLYADFGVREYWIMSLQDRETELYRRTDGRYGAPDRVSFESGLSLPGVEEPLIVARVIG